VTYETSVEKLCPNFPRSWSSSIEYIIPAEHVNRFMVADLHRDRFRDYGFPHVPHCGSAQIMDQEFRKTRCLRCLVPILA
jgi:hypothetical protein